MRSADQERMDALSEAIIRLLRRLDALDRRVSRIEEALALSPEQPAAPVETEAPVAETPVAAPPETPPEPAPAMPAAGQPRGLETRLGLTWINRVAVVTCILAAGFFFKYAVDNRWIGETGRVALGIAAGMITLGAAEGLFRRGHSIYAQGVCGLAAAILYLSFYAAFGYRLLPQTASFLLMALTTAMAVVLAIRYASVAIAALALAGGYATPVLVSTGDDRPWFLFTYVLLLNLGARFIAKLQGWRRLENLAFAGTVVLYGGWLTERASSGTSLVAGLFAMVFYAVFATVPSPRMLYASQVLAAFALASAWSLQPASYFLSTLAVSAAGLVIADRRNWPAAANVAYASFFLAALAYELDRSIVPLAAGILFLTAAFLLFSLWTPWRILVRRLPAQRLDLTIVVLNAAGYFGVCYWLLEDRYGDYLGLLALGLAAAHLALARHVWGGQPEELRDARPPLLYAGAALTFLTLAIPLQFSEFRITIVWALEGAGLAWIAARMSSIRLAYAALAVFGLVLARLFGLDLEAARAPRLLTFTAASAGFWMAAHWLRQGWRASAWMPLATYVSGHAALLGVLIFEVLDWARRTSAGDSLRSVESASVSILVAAYAVLLVASGVLTRLGINRILGLGLIAFVVAKLYLYDVWLLERIYRVVAFAGLGALLLAMSYLYSRFRESIENWWRNERSGD